MKISKIEIFEINDKCLKMALLLILNKLTKIDIVEIYPIGFSHSLPAILKTDTNNDK
jgi:hypothetical protein